jgi:hypothetical protein
MEFKIPLVRALQELGFYPLEGETEKTTNGLLVEPKSRAPIATRQQGKRLFACTVEPATGIIIGIAFALVVLIGIGWLGLEVKPKPFAPYPGQIRALETTPVPGGLPAPVERFYRAIYGEQILAIDSAVISGRAQLRVFGIPLWGCFYFTHIAGWDYRHYIETTVFGLPVMKVNETYLDRKSRQELPFGVIEAEPKVDQAANLGLWGESV